MKNQHLFNRESLKAFFKKGQSPSELHFSYLIESMINKLDDGFSKNEEDGFQLSPIGDADTVLSIFKEQTDTSPSWQINLKEDSRKQGLSFDHVDLDESGREKPGSVLFLSNDGKVGIGTEMPRVQLEIAGTTGIHTRIGAYAIRSVPGDGKWHPVLSGLDGIQAFEVMAQIKGPAGRGKYAMTHGIALCAFGGSKRKIRQTRTYFGWFWNRIEFRWSGDTHQYNLDVRTRSHYGLQPDKQPFPITCHITRLWDDQITTVLTAQ